MTVRAPFFDSPQRTTPDLLDHQVSHVNGAPMVVALLEAVASPAALLDADREVIPGNTRLAIHLVEELQAQRDLVAAEAGTLVVNRAAVRPAVLLDDVRQLYAHHEVGQGKALVAQVFASAPALTTDPGLLRRVLGNLVRNALDASTPGQQVTLRHTWIGPRATFTVHNPAVMPQAARLQVFQRGSPTRDAGRGLGTYGTRLIAERYLSGTLRFGSNAGTGTVFALDLPMQP